MSDEPLNFEEFRRRREENAGTVRCAKCGEWIAATTTECGVNFQGQAQDFIHASDKSDDRTGAPAWVVVLAVLTLLSMTLVALRGF